MKIAVTYEAGTVFQHFGHTEQFKVYTVEDNKIISSEVLSTDGVGHGALSQLLKSRGITTLICGGIGTGAKSALTASGIVFYAGVTGNVDAQVQALLDGTLQYDPDTECDHHDHDHSHGSCGEHGHH